MPGVLFIIIIPRTDYENELKKQGKLPTEKIGAPQSINAYGKSKTIDFLNIDRKKVLEKSYSELVLGVEYEDKRKNSNYKNYVKNSWDDIKQTIKPPRKQKLKITSPPKHDHSVTDAYWEISLENILIDILKRLSIQSAAWTLNNNDRFWQVQFSLDSGPLCEELLQVLRSFGIGCRYQSSVSVIPCALYYKTDSGAVKTACLTDNEEFCESSWSRFASSVRSRTNLAQILHDVRCDAALTFDWLFLLIVAAFVAAIGLVENSTVILVASMLISPLMGPITAGTLGTSLKDRSLQRMGLQHELLGLFLSLVIGFVFGLAICAVDERYGVGDWPTNEMMSRCEIRSLWVGVLVAIPSGAGVALAILGENTPSLVGVAISASLLPPAVNAGLLWAMSLVHLVYMDDVTRWTSVVKTTTYSTNQAVELAALGTVSLCLTLVNIACIILAGVVVYKVKEVSPKEPQILTRWNRNSRRFSRTFYKTEPSDPWDFYRWCQAPENHSKTNESYLSSSQNVSCLFSSESSSSNSIHHLTNHPKHYFTGIETSIKTNVDLPNEKYKLVNISEANDNSLKELHDKKTENNIKHNLTDINYNIVNKSVIENSVNSSINSADSLDEIEVFKVPDINKNNDNINNFNGNLPSVDVVPSNIDKQSYLL